MPRPPAPTSFRLVLPILRSDSCVFVCLGWAACAAQCCATCSPPADSTGSLTCFSPTACLQLMHSLRSCDAVHLFCTRASAADLARGRIGLGQVGQGGSRVDEAVAEVMERAACCQCRMSLSVSVSAPCILCAVVAVCASTRNPLACPFQALQLPSPDHDKKLFMLLDAQHGNVFVMSTHSGQVLTVGSGTTVSEGPVQYHKCQKWRLVDAEGGCYFLASRSTGSCLGVRGLPGQV